MQDKREQDNYPDLAVKAAEVAQQVICGSVERINAIIAASKICKVIGGVRKCLGPIRPQGC